MFFDDLKNSILCVPPEEPVFIYVGVGTAAGMREADGSLALTNYHQFPPFLQDLHNNYPDLHIFLALIDPRQEEPPYVITDERRQGLSISVSVSNSISNSISKLHVHVWRQDVYTDPDENPSHGGLNITKHLRYLNQFALEHNASLLYHDFTGRRTALLAEYFDNELAGHLDQIVYGLSARENHGCYFDLSHITSYYATRFFVTDDRYARPILKIFNYYHYIIRDRLDLAMVERNEYGPAAQPLIEAQRHQIMNDILTQFNNTHLTMLRQLYRQKHRTYNNSDNAENAEEVTFYITYDLPKVQRQLYSDLWAQRDYDSLELILFNYCAHQLDIYTRLKPSNNFNGETLLKMITSDDDPYQWGRNISDYI